MTDASVPGPISASPHGATYRAWFWALAGWTALLCFYDLGGGARFEPIDCWVAQTAREMQAAGDWLVPHFAGEPRMQKSPGAYWAVMLTAEVRGEPVDIVAARIPSAIAAILLVLTVYWLARHVAGERAAVFAGFAASSSVLVLWWSHRPASDLGLTLWTTLSLAALWIAAEATPNRTRRRWLFLLGYFAAGMGMLYKLPMPLVVVGLPAALYALYRRRWSVFADWIHLVGLLIFLLPWLPWAAAVAIHAPDALARWRVESLDRFTGDLPNVGDQGSWKWLAYYVPVPFLYCMPFALSLPMACARAVRPPAGARRAGTHFLLIWVVSLFVFLTASAGKEYRYFLPALPPLFVLLGIELARLFDPARPVQPDRDRAAVRLVWILTPLVVIAGGGTAMHFWWKLRGAGELAAAGVTAFDAWLAFGGVAAVVTCGACVSAWLYARRREHAAFGTLVGMMYVLWLWAWPRLMPLLLSQNPYIDFAQRLVDPAQLPPAYRADLCQIGTHDPRLIWYSNLKFPRLIEPGDLLLEQRARYERGEQKTLRDLDYELQRYGEEMVAALERPTPVLFVIGVPELLAFINEAPAHLAAADRPVPPLHLWFQTAPGREDRQFVLCGNVPPPYAEPTLRLSEKVAKQLRDKGRRMSWPRESSPSSAPSSMPAATTQPTSAPLSTSP